MKYFFDTEFSERGPEHPIQLISIGIVAEDGREFFAHADWYDADACNDWVKANVLPKVEGRPRWSREEIGKAIVDFVGDQPEFWAYFGAYDWVVLCQVFGDMMGLPTGWPMWCRDLKQAIEDFDPKMTIPEQKMPEHDALNDARWTKEIFEWLEWERRAENDGE